MKLNYREKMGLCYIDIDSLMVSLHKTGDIY